MACAQRLLADSEMPAPRVLVPAYVGIEPPYSVGSNCVLGVWLRNERK